jgi:hypothetical protein
MRHLLPPTPTRFCSRVPFCNVLAAGALALCLSASATPAAAQGPDAHSQIAQPIGGWQITGEVAAPSDAQRFTEAQREARLAAVARQRALLNQRAQAEPQESANPEAAEQSELLKNSKDPDFILRHFKTMWVDARDAQYFGSEQMKAALGGNAEFQKLNIRIVDDPRVADVLLKVSYTFAWDYPFQLKHQNTTMVLLSGKGEGPFSGPLGAADVARQFVNAVKKWREERKAAADKR